MPGILCYLFRRKYTRYAFLDALGLPSPTSVWGGAGGACNGELV